MGSAWRSRFPFGITVSGYLLAQLIVLYVWLVNIWEYGVGPPEDAISDAFLTFCVAATLPALLLGVFDGAARASRRRILQLLAALLLILLSFFWIALLSGLLQAGENLFYGPPASRTDHLTALAISEIALAAEWLVATAIFLAARLVTRYWRRNRRW